MGSSFDPSIYTPRPRPRPPIGRARTWGAHVDPTWPAGWRSGAFRACGYYEERPAGRQGPSASLLRKTIIKWPSFPFPFSCVDGDGCLHVLRILVYYIHMGLPYHSTTRFLMMRR